METPELEEEVNVMDLLANNESAEEDDYEDEDEEMAEEVDSDELKARLNKRNRSLKKSKQAIHRMQDESSAQEKRIAELEAKINSTSTSPDPEAARKARSEELEEWRNSVADDPSKAVDFSTWQAKQTQDSVVDYIVEMRKEYDAQIAELKGASNPDRQTYAKELKAMSENPKWSGLDDDTKIEVIKSMKGAVGKLPRGSVGGKRASVEPEEFKMTDEIRKRMGFEVEG